MGDPRRDRKAESVLQESDLPEMEAQRQREAGPAQLSGTLLLRPSS